MSPETQQTGRLEVTAQRKPVFEVVPVTADELKQTRKEIYAVTSQFMALRKEVLDLLPTLPGIPKTKHLPIELSLVVQKENPSNEKK